MSRKIFRRIGCRGKCLGKRGAKENIWENRVLRKIFVRIGCRGKNIWENRVLRKIFGRIGCRGKFLGK
jgi:hypothetical protein